MKPRYHRFLEKETDPRYRAASLLVFLLWSALALHVCVSHAAASGTPWCHPSGLVPTTERDVLLLEEPTFDERLQLTAIEVGCRHYGVHVDPYDLLALLRLEHVLGVARWRPGLLVGVFCVEAGLRTRSRAGGLVYGDFYEGVPRAWGPFQLWPTHRRDCGSDEWAAHDLIWSARCWVTRIDRVLYKAQKRCTRNTMMVAEAAVANHHVYGWRCDAASSHWETAEKIWRRYETIRETTEVALRLGAGLFKAP